MQGKEKTMTEIRNIIHQLRLGRSKRSISKDLNVHRSIVRELFNLAIKYQWLDLNCQMPTDEEIDKAKNRKTSTRQHPLSPYHKQISAWHQEGLSSVVIQQLLKNQIVCDVQSIRRYRQKYFPKAIEPIMVRTTVAGRDMELDFGELGNFLDEDNQAKRVWLFSLRLRHSRKAYREIVLDQTIPTFLMGHVHAFEHFNGVPVHCIPDNLKSAVIKSTIDNEWINRSYQELAEHYGFIISPCRPRTPEHKGGVEGDVKYVKRNFLATFLAQQKQSGIQSPLIKDLKVELEIWDKEVADVHLVYGIGRSPSDLFTNEEAQALRPLPKERFDHAVWKQCSVRKDWRIMLESSFYSVPYGLIGKTVECKINHSSVRIFFEHQEVAFHPKAKKPWEYVRKTEHAPPFKEAVLQCSREGLLMLAKEVGPFTCELVEKILAHPSVDKLKPARCLLNLSVKHSKERLEKAAERALICKIDSYQSVKTILAKGLEYEQINKPIQNKEQPTESFRFARKPEDYKVKCSESKSETFNEKFERLHPFSLHGNAMGGAVMAISADKVIEHELYGCI